MRFSRRVPERTPNAWSQALAARRASGATLLDLTETNPTRTGLAPGLEDAPWRELAAQPYEPDPRGLPDARAAVAAYYAERGGVVDPDHVVLVSGTGEGFAHLLRALADPGEAVLIPRPSYPLFEPIARAEGVEVRTYRLEYDGRWRLDVDSLGERDARAVILVQPHHPTGTVLEAAELEAVTLWCERHGAALIADEVFADHRWSLPARTLVAAADPPPPETPPAFETLAGEARVPTFVLSGLSKVCGLPQAKVAWIVAAGPPDVRDEALGRLEWLSDLFLSVSTPAQRQVPGWLGRRSSFQARVHGRLEHRIRALAAFVRTHPEVSWIDSEAGWVAALRLPARRDEDAWVREALERDLVVHPGHFYDFEQEPVLVLSLIVESEVWGRGLERLDDLLDS